MDTRDICAFFKNKKKRKKYGKMKKIHIFFENIGFFFS